MPCERRTIRSSRAVGLYANIRQKLNFQKIKITKCRRTNMNQVSRSILNQYCIFNHVFDGQLGFWCKSVYNDDYTF